MTMTRNFRVALRLNAFFRYIIRNAAAAVADSQNMKNVKRSPERTAPKSAAVKMNIMAR